MEEGRGCAAVRQACIASGHEFSLRAFVQRDQRDHRRERHLKARAQQRLRQQQQDRRCPPAGLMQGFVAIAFDHLRRYLRQVHQFAGAARHGRERRVQLSGIIDAAINATERRQYQPLAFEFDHQRIEFGAQRCTDIAGAGQWWFGARGGNILYEWHESIRTKWQTLQRGFQVHLQE